MTFPYQWIQLSMIISLWMTDASDDFIKTIKLNFIDFIIVCDINESPDLVKETDR